MIQIITNHIKDFFLLDGGNLQLDKSLLRKR